MLVRIGGRRVDVARSDCGGRPCFQLGFDKGSYSPGRGYTSYHRDARGRRVEKPVCMTRHLHGCPSNSVCPSCRTLSVLAPGERCDRPSCDGVLVRREGGST
jgi:hypothetical protein